MKELNINELDMVNGGVISVSEGFVAAGTGALAGAATGATIGGMIGGPPGAVAGAVILGTVGAFTRIVSAVNGAIKADQE